MEAGKRMLQEFIDQRLKLFASSRNDPTEPALSNMSPWFHFGVPSSPRDAYPRVGMRCPAAYLVTGCVDEVSNLKKQLHFDLFACLFYSVSRHVPDAHLAPF